MEQLTPQLMHKLVFTILMHGLNDSQIQLAHKVLTDALSHSNLQVRELAVVALADLPVPAQKKVNSLILALEDESARVRRRAARALGDMGPAAVQCLPQLIVGIRDTDSSVRRDCAGALGRIGPQAHQAVPGLISMLSDPENRTRAVVAVAIKRIGKAAVEPLLAGVQSPSPELRGHCATLLAKLAPDDDTVAAVLHTVLTDEDAEVRARADAALQYVNTPPPMHLPMRQTLTVEV
ncbi:MAG: HEAT repeat domain-containing protein [Fimbriiglobus sp.]